MSLGSFGDAFAAARDAVGLPKELGLHCLRHSYVTHLIEAGYDAGVRADTGWPLVRLNHRPLHIGIVGLQAENRAADDRTPHQELGGPRCLNSAESATAGTCEP
jgi:hypothetical protein